MQYVHSFRQSQYSSLPMEVRPSPNDSRLHTLDEEGVEGGEEEEEEKGGEGGKGDEGGKEGRRDKALLTSVQLKASLSRIDTATVGMRLTRCMAAHPRDSAPNHANARQ